MGDINLQATTSTPAVTLDWQAGRLRIEGESYPENSFDFYAPILEQVGAFLENEGRPFELQVNLTYLNTSSIKCVMDLLDMMEEAYQDGRQAVVNWYYEEDNDRALDVAEEFKEDVTLPFNIVTVPPHE